MIATAVRNILPLDEQKEVSLLDNDNDELLKAAVSYVVTACKSLVSYMKRSGLNNKLASTQQANDTRWNSLLVMLESIMKVKGELKNLLESIHKQEKFEKIDLNMV